MHNQTNERKRTNMDAIITKHAEQRTNERLANVVNMDEILNAARKCDPKKSRYWQVKKIAYIELVDPSVKPDGIARGDQIVIVVDQVKNVIEVQTVMLRKSWSKSGDYMKVMHVH